MLDIMAPWAPYGAVESAGVVQQSPASAQRRARRQRRLSTGCTVAGLVVLALLSARPTGAQVTLDQPSQRLNTSAAMLFNMQTGFRAISAAGAADAAGAAAGELPLRSAGRQLAAAKAPTRKLATAKRAPTKKRPTRKPPTRRPTPRPTRRLPPPPPKIPGARVVVLAKGVPVSGRTGRLTAAVAGVTVGGRYRTTNAMRYYQRLGVNSLRMFSNVVAPYRSLQSDTFGYSLSGVRVNNEAAWRAAVAQLRTPAGRDPANTGWAMPNKWDKIIWNIRTAGSGLPTFAADLQALRAAGYGIEFILPAGSCAGLDIRQPNWTVSAYWQERWEVFRVTYVIARFLALNGVASIETMNEPDLLTDKEATPECGFTPSEWLDQLAIRSMAARAAYTDQRRGVIIKAGPFAKYGYYSSLSLLTGKNAYMQFPNISNGKRVTAKGPRLFDVFAYNMYNVDGQRATTVAVNTLSGLRRDTGVAVPVSVGEYSAFSARDFDLLGGANTADTPQWAARWAAITAANLQVTSGTFAFTFGTNSEPGKAPRSGVKKNLLHWTETAAPYRVGDTTLAAEANRLLFTYAVGRPIMALAVTPQSASHTLLAVDCGSYLRLFSIVESTAVVALNINFAAWGVAPGALITAEEVSATRRGELRPLVPFPGGYFGYSQPGQSLVMFSVPKGPKKVGTAVRQAAADTTLFAGNKQGTSLQGAEPTLTVRTAADGNQDMTAVALLRFDLGIDPARILLATLSLTVAASGPGPNIFTILGINGWRSDWQEGNTTWADMPNLAPLPKGVVINTIGANFVNWVGTAPQPQVAGHLTTVLVDGTTRATRKVDVTDFVKNGGEGGSRTLVIYRPYRHAAYGDIPADSLTNSRAAFASSEAANAAQRPTLTLQYQ